MIKTPEQYRESLKDGRFVFYEGQKIYDLESDPVLKAGVELCAMDYTMMNDPKFRDLFVDTDENGEEYSFVFKMPKTKEDLQRRREIIKTMSRTCLEAAGGAKFTGVDALHSITATTMKMDKEMGTNYNARVEAFRKDIMKNDSALVVAMTDIKGNRSLRPSKQEQHKDFYVHIVEEREDGIVVRGAKAHISHSPFANEIIAVPCRAMREDEKDYAVAFAVKPNTPGLKLILAKHATTVHDKFEAPITGSRYIGDAIVVFDDVFIPNDRVFLKGEWQYAGEMAYMFSNFHRLSADSYKINELEILTGTAALLAEYNGLEKVSHVKEKLSWLMYYSETAEALGMVAIDHFETDPITGMVYPNSMYSNCAKYFFATQHHHALSLMQDIGGGILSTIPSAKDLYNPECRPYIDKYLQGKAGIPAEYRMRAIHLARDVSEATRPITTLHAEGSLYAQVINFSTYGDWDLYKAAAKRAANIPDDKKTVFSDLPDFGWWRDAIDVNKDVAK